MRRLVMLCALCGVACTDFDAFRTTFCGSGYCADAGADDAGTPDAGPVCGPQIDLAGDVLNCGRCGRSCHGGACDAGVCGVVVLASSQPNPDAVAASGHYVAWSNWVQANGGDVRRLDLNDGGRFVKSAIDTPDSVALDGELFVWSPGAGASEGAYSLGADGGIVRLTSGAIRYLAAHGGKLAWTHSDVEVIDEGGSGTVHTLATAVAFATRIALTDQWAVWIDPMEGTVAANNLQGTSPQQLFTSSTPLNVAVAPGRVYWLEASRGDAGASVWSAAFDGTFGSAEKVASGRPDDGYGIAADLTGVYWSEPTAGRLFYSPADGGPIQTISTNATAGVALTPEMLFWAGNGAILGLAR